MFLVLPALIVVPMALTPRDMLEFPPRGVSVRPFVDFFHDRAWTDAALTSFEVAALAVACATILGTAAAWALHGWTTRTRGVVAGMILVPLAIPSVVLAIADFEVFARLRLVGTVFGIGMAHAVITAPYVYLAVNVSLFGLDPTLIRSAESLGATWLTVYRRLYWPITRGGILAGGVFAFAVSFDEVVVSLFLQAPGATTLPVQMFTAIQYDLAPKIAAVAALLVGASSAIFLLQGGLMGGRRAVAARLNLPVASRAQAEATTEV